MAENISKLIDILLKPLCPKFITSYIGDTFDFLDSLKPFRASALPTNILLCTLDVRDMFTSIQHNEGIDAALFYYDKLDSCDKIISPNSLRILLESVLNFNIFEFNQQMYTQIRGVAMGSRCAPNYANCFMGRLETDFLDSQPIKPLLYLRYLDDIFIIWDRGETSLLSFIDDFNKFNPSITLTHQISNTTINYLDVTLYLDENRYLQTTVYKKPTDNGKYLHFHSDHPPHTKLSLPYSQGIRYKRICSTDSELQGNLSGMVTKFASRNYPGNVLHSAVSRISDYGQNNVLQRATSTAPKLVTTYSKNLGNLQNVVKKHFNILQSANPNAFTEAPLVVFRRSQNIRDIVVNSKVNNPNASVAPNTVQIHNCNNLSCLICPLQLKSTIIRSTANSKIFFKIVDTLGCNSSNIVYLLQCSGCKKQYIGQTDTPFDTRYSTHCSHATHDKNNPFYIHKQQTGHTFENFRVVFLRGNFKNKKERTQFESHLIHEFDTIKYGLNRDPGVFRFYVT